MRLTNIRRIGFFSKDIEKTYKTNINFRVGQAINVSIRLTTGHAWEKSILIHASIRIPK
jgi:hypothetical protein